MGNGFQQAGSPRGARHAPYTLTHSAGTATVRANQRGNGGAWNSLGTFAFPANAAQAVTLGVSSTGAVIADAVKFLPAPNRRYVYADHLGTPRVITDTAHTVLWRWEADPFGVGLPNEDADGNGVRFPYPLRFPGQYYDAETGLHYNYFRDYDPGLGRYGESDPVGLEGGINTYAYAEGNPIKFIDPDGLSAGSGLGLGAAIIACSRIPACKKAVEAAIKACKDVRCKVTRHTAHHRFLGLGYCEHMQIVCHIKGGGLLFRDQFPLPGRCSPNKSPGDWLPDKSGDIRFGEMPFGE